MYKYFKTSYLIYILFNDYYTIAKYLSNKHTIKSITIISYKYITTMC
jgi:hypothetical protein